MVEAGFYKDLKNDDYRAQKSWVSISELSMFRIAPFLYKYYVLGSKNKPKSKSMDEGTAFHEKILEPEYFDRYVGRLLEGDQRKVLAKGHKEGLVEKGYTSFLGADLYDRCVAGHEELKRHKTANDLLKHVQSEVSIFWRMHGIRCKARFDAINELEDISVDLKTTQDARNFQDSILKYGYHRQAAFYMDGYEILTGRKLKHWYWIAMETKSPYFISVHEPDSLLIEAGRREYMELLEKYQKCLMTNSYPKLPETIQKATLPEWYIRKNMSDIKEFDGGEHGI